MWELDQGVFGKAVIYGIKKCPVSGSFSIVTIIKDLEINDYEIL